MEIAMQFQHVSITVMVNRALKLYFMNVKNTILFSLTMILKFT